MKELFPSGFYQKLYYLLEKGNNCLFIISYDYVLCLAT